MSRNHFKLAGLVKHSVPHIIVNRMPPIDRELEEAVMLAATKGSLQL